MAKKRIFLTGLLTLFLLLSTVSCLELEEPSSVVDSDGDGWSDTQEKTAGTDPNNVDTDDDGYWDPHDPNPLDPNIPVDKGLPEPVPGETATPTPTPTPTPTTPSAASANTTATMAIDAEEATLQELRKVQDAVEVMMRNNDLTRIAHPVTIPTSDMHRFPDVTTRHGTAGVGYVLFLHDWNGDGSPDTNYIRGRKTKGTYICDEYGNVTQVTIGYE